MPEKCNYNWEEVVDIYKGNLSDTEYDSYKMILDTIFNNPLNEALRKQLDDLSDTIGKGFPKLTIIISEDKSLSSIAQNNVILLNVPQHKNVAVIDLQSGKKFPFTLDTVLSHEIYHILDIRNFMIEKEYKPEYLNTSQIEIDLMINGGSIRKNRVLKEIRDAYLQSGRDSYTNEKSGVANGNIIGLLHGEPDRDYYMLASLLRESLEDVIYYTEDKNYLSDHFEPLPINFGDFILVKSFLNSMSPSEKFAGELNNSVARFVEMSLFNDEENFEQYLKDIIIRVKDCPYAPGGGTVIKHLITTAPDLLLKDFKFYLHEYKYYIDEMNTKGIPIDLYDDYINGRIEAPASPTIIPKDTLKNKDGRGGYIKPEFETGIKQGFMTISEEYKDIDHTELFKGTKKSRAAINVIEHDQKTYIC